MRDRRGIPSSHGGCPNGRGGESQDRGPSKVMTNFFGADLLLTAQ
jgi:hypothetical protein